MEVTIIYELSKNNIPFYIGKSKNPKTRINPHKKNFGTDIILTCIDEVPTEDWRTWERYWIMQYKAWGFDLVNIASGGNGTTFHTLETKQKISKKIKNRISPSKGRKMTDEEKQLRSQKAKERFSKKHHPSKGKTFTSWISGKNHGHFGKPKQEHQKQQMSKSAIKRHERQNNNK